MRQFRLQNGAKLTKPGMSNATSTLRTGGAQGVESFSERVAIERARWLAELATALADARRLTEELNCHQSEGDSANLAARIEAIQLEIQAMQLRRGEKLAQHQHPEWTLLWTEPPAAA